MYINNVAAGKFTHTAPNSNHKEAEWIKLQQKEDLFCLTSHLLGDLTSAARTRN